MDLLRIIAMAMVMWNHTTVFAIDMNQPFTLRNTIAPISVDLFFVLSGYLFGAGLFRKPDQFSVKKFYANRLLRLLPVYYLALLWTKKLNRNTIPWRTFFLIQNFDEKSLEYMPTAWSLCVEEWTYVVLILIFLFICILNKNKKERAMVMAATVVIAVAIILRVMVVVSQPDIWWDVPVRKQTLLRMDTFGFGILAAYFEINYHEKYEKVVKSWWMAILGLIGLGYGFMVYYHFCHGGNDPLEKILLYTVFPLASVYLMLIWKDLKIFQSAFMQKLAKPIAFLSFLTYPLYVIHLQNYIRWSNVCRVQGIFDTRPYIVRAIVESFIWALVVHFVVELPINHLRKKNAKGISL